MTCRDCERMREALRRVEVMPHTPRCQRWDTGEGCTCHVGVARAALAPDSEPPAVHAPVNTRRDVNEDAVERVAGVVFATCHPITRDRSVEVAKAVLAALGDPAAEVRAVLREVLAAPCDTSEGEYACATVLEAMSSMEHTGVGTPGKVNAVLLKRAEEACK